VNEGAVVGGDPSLGSGMARPSGDSGIVVPVAGAYAGPRLERRRLGCRHEHRKPDRLRSWTPIHGGAVNPWRAPRHGRRMRLGLGPALLLAGLAACSAADPGPEVVFSVRHSDHTLPRGWRPDVHVIMAAAAGGPGWIHVNGFLPLPDHCDVVRARVEEGASGLTLWITARDDQEHTNPCGRAGEVSIGIYDARIEPLAPGPHRLRVVYDYGRMQPRAASGGGPLYPEHTALDARVQVD